VPEGVQGIDFTTTGFERMVPPPPRAELPPVEGVEMTLSSFQSQISAPAPPPPPELADDSGADLGRRPAAAAPLTVAAGVEELLTPSPEDQTTPSGPVPTPEERRAAALALLEEVGTRAAGTAPSPAPPTFAFVEAAAPEPFAEPAPPEPPEPPAPPAPAPVVTPPPVFSAPPVAAAPARVESPRVEPAAAAAPAAVAAPRELSQDEVDRIARRVLELADTLIERIAWEVIPDMAEMMVRQRIRELEEAAEEES
jgi:hypothetical protein